MELQTQQARVVSNVACRSLGTSMRVPSHVTHTKHERPVDKGSSAVLRCGKHARAARGRIQPSDKRAYTAI
eukprot:5226438-Pleurochrysis_carterae.AAC.1